MRESIKEMAEKYGTDSVHLIAHSKGGLDSRIFLEGLRESPLSVQVGEMDGIPVSSDLTVPSLVTHGTPHQGTVIADMVAVYSGPLVFLFSDLCDLTTQVMQQVNSILTVLPDTTSLLIGADADQNSSGQIEDFEAIGNQVGSSMANSFYQKLRDVARIYVEFIPSLGDSSQSIPNIVEVPTITPQLNDTMVTVESALAMPGASETIMFLEEYSKNHGTVIDQEVQNFVINEGLGNTLNWRFR